MAINRQDSRHRIKRSNLTGVVPTVPTSSDFTDGTWLNTDLCSGELFWNEADNQLFIGATGQAFEIALVGGTGSGNSLEQTLAIGNNTGTYSIQGSTHSTLTFDVGGGTVSTDIMLHTDIDKASSDIQISATLFGGYQSQTLLNSEVRVDPSTLITSRYQTLASDANLAYNNAITTYGLTSSSYINGYSYGNGSYVEIRTNGVGGNTATSSIVLTSDSIGNKAKIVANSDNFRLDTLGNLIIGDFITIDPTATNNIVSGLFHTISNFSANNISGNSHIINSHGNVVGGQYHYINSGGLADSNLVTGETHYLDGVRASAVSGELHSMTSSSCNNVTGFNNNTNHVNNSIIGGEFMTLADNKNMFAIGHADNSGDFLASYGTVISSVQTTTSAPAVSTTSNNLQIPTNRSYSIRILGIGTVKVAGGLSGAAVGDSYWISNTNPILVRNIAGTTTFIGTPTLTFGGSTSFTINASVAIVPNELQIQVTPSLGGPSPDTIDWAFKVEYTSVSF